MNTTLPRSGRVRLAALGTTAALAASLTFGVASPAHAAAPVGGDDAYSLTEGTPLTVAAPGLFANDSDPEGDAFAFHSVWPPAGGPLAGEELQVTPTGGFTYTPPTGFSGTRTWQYRLQDAAEVSEYIAITFTVNAAPNQAPVGVADSYTTPVDTPLVIAAPGLLANDSDPDGDAIFVEATGGHQAGELVASVNGGFTFTPAPGFEGTKQFYYRVRDAEASSPNVPITITVGDGAATPQAPVAVDDAYSVTAGQALDVPAPGFLANDSDADSPFSASVTTFPSDGALTFDAATGAFSYTPDPGFVGTDTFIYELADGTGLVSQPATVSIEVTPAPNTAPVAVDDAYTVTAGSVLAAGALGSPEPGVLANDSDADGDTIAVDTWNLPLGGLLAGEVFAINPNGSFEYHAPTGFTGTRTFFYTSTDGLLSSDVAELVITVTEPATPDTAPIATDDAFSVETSTPLAHSAPGVLANDTDAEGDTLQVAGHTLPAGGLLPGEAFTLAADGTLHYTAPSGFSGVREFGYTVTDGSLTSNAATIRFTVRDAAGTPPTPTLPTPDPEIPTLPGRPEDGGGDSSSLASTGAEAAGAAATAGLAGLLLALGLLARRLSRRAA